MPWYWMIQLYIFQRAVSTPVDSQILIWALQGEFCLLGAQLGLEDVTSDCAHPPETSAPNGCQRERHPPNRSICVHLPVDHVAGEDDPILRSRRTEGPGVPVVSHKTVVTCQVSDQVPKNKPGKRRTSPLPSWPTLVSLRIFNRPLSGVEPTINLHGMLLWSRPSASRWISIPLPSWRSWSGLKLNEEHGKTLKKERTR